jgi:hypothetical protein
MWGLWWTKRHWGWFSPSTSTSPANHHSSNFYNIIITRGWHNRPICGRSAEWTQLDSTPTITIKKINGVCSGEVVTRRVVVNSILLYFLQFQCLNDVSVCPTYILFNFFIYVSFSHIISNSDYIYIAPNGRTINK